MNYKITVLTDGLLNELKLKGLAWKHYKLQYHKTFAVFPPNNEKPLIVTEAVWKNYFKELWDKGYYVYSYKQALNSCENVDYRWAREYRTYDHLNEVYEDKECDNQKHEKYNTSWVSTVRKTWSRNERAKFRHTNTWINFRNSMVESHNCTCEKCNRRFPNEQMEVHHLIEDEDYDNLDPSRFLVLCFSCHDKIHNYDEIREVTPIKKIKKIKPIKKIKKIANTQIDDGEVCYGTKIK